MQICAAQVKPLGNTLSLDSTKPAAADRPGFSAIQGTATALNAVQRVNEIDLMRFVAAIMVMFFHYAFRGYAADGYSAMPYPLLEPLAKYGYLGVELFFLISGFVILMTASSGSIRAFVVSRIVRLYPAFWACCTITFLAILAIGGTRFSASLGQYAFNMTLLSEFTPVPAIDGVYWSLAIEMKFYALVGLLLLTRQMHRAQLYLVLWLLATFALELFPVARLRSLLIADYAPYFIAGAMCFLIFEKGAIPSRVLVVVAAWGLAMRDSLSSVAGLERHFQVHFDSDVILVSVSIFFALMMLVSLRSTGFIGRRNWVVIGALTYPLYLIHQRLGYMIFNLAYPRVNEHVVLWMTVFIMLGLAYLVNRHVERRVAKPMRRLLEGGLAFAGKKKSALTR